MLQQHHQYIYMYIYIYIFPDYDLAAVTVKNEKQKNLCTQAMVHG